MHTYFVLPIIMPSITIRWAASFRPVHAYALMRWEEGTTGCQYGNGDIDLVLFSDIGKLHRMQVKPSFFYPSTSSGREARSIENGYTVAPA